MKLSIIASMLVVLFTSQFSSAADTDCAAANLVGKKIYSRAYTMSQALRDQQALTATQDFWALNDHFGSCPEIIRIATALRTSGFGSDKQPDTNPIPLFNSGTSGASASGKFDAPGLQKGVGGAISAGKPKISLIVDGIEFVPQLSAETVRKFDTRGLEQSKAAAAIKK